MQWIAVRAATRTFDGALHNWQNMVPFYIRLRQCMRSELPKPEEFPALVTPMIADTMPNGWVHRKLKGGQAIVLVDGVDEVPETRREEVHSWLHDLIDTFPHALFFVTSRPHGIPDGWMNHTPFSRTNLQDMTLSDIFAFIDHWHTAVQAEMSTEEEKRELKPLAEQLKSEITVQRPLQKLAQNPLLCAMLCALHRERRSHLPVNRLELYNACCTLLLDRRERESHVDLSEYPTLHLGQKERLLQDLAYWMMQEGLTEAATDQVALRFAHKLAHMPGVSEEISGEKVLQLLVERTGILREIVDGQIDFTHRTFEEFYTAREILSLGEIEPLLDKAHEQQWREVIILTAGIAPKQICESMIVRLIQRGDAEPAYRHTLYLLAVACLETIIELDNTVKREVEQRLSRIMPPKNMTEAKAIAASGELAVKYLNFQEKRSATISAACVRALTLIGGETALTLLEAYTKDKRATVTDELIKSWNFFEREIYARRIVAKLVEEQAYRVAFSKIVSLAGFQHLHHLLSLHLSACSQIVDLAPLASLSALSSLHLSYCSQIVDLTPLASLSALSSLHLSGCSQIVDLTPLASLSRLRKLTKP
jgi:hypothetical protein